MKESKSCLFPLLTPSFLIQINWSQWHTRSRPRTNFCFLHFALHVQQAVRDTLQHNNKSQSHADRVFYYDTLFSTVVRDLGRSLNFVGEKVEEEKYLRCHLMRKGIYRAAVLIQWEQIIGLENEFQFCSYRLWTCSVTYRNTKAPRPPVFSRLDKNDCWHQDPASVWNMKHVSQWWDSWGWAGPSSRAPAARTSANSHSSTISGYYNNIVLCFFF